MTALRTPEGKKKYQAYLASGELLKKCPLCAREPLKKFSYWKVIKNHYPYDKIAKVHDMLVPLRHAAGDELRPEELEELTSIKNSLNSEYDWFVEATHKNQSIPAHFHLHLLVGK